MIEPAFFDTNVYLYLYSRDPADASKRTIARDLLTTHEPVISSQVLQEFIAASLKKRHLGITEEDIDHLLQLTADFPFQAISHDLIVRSTDTRRRFQISHCDATLLAASQELGCRTLYSEDLSHEQSYDGVRVLNPFR